VAEGAERFQGRVGTTIRDKWRIDAFLSAGSMAAVYAGTHRNGMRGALKILHAHLSRDPALRKRFLREAYLANKVNHPCALRILDDDLTEDGSAFLVMELLDGETLEKRRLRMKKMPLVEVLDIADQLLDVLASAHEVSVVHRDLKPDNVLILNNGTIKVLDFGIAQVWDGARSSETTESGTILGSPSYMPPEQARGARDEVGARSDIWAVGATIFTLLSGETVHPGETARAKLLATTSNPARPLQSVAPEVPRAVASVIDRALAFHPKDRWPDASAMREALRWAAMGVGGSPVQKRPSFAPEPPKHAEDTVTDFDVNLVAERAKSIIDDEDTTTRRARRHASPESTTQTVLPAFKASDLQPASYLESEPTIRRDPAAERENRRRTPPPQVPDAGAYGSYPHRYGAPGMAPAPPAARARPRMLGFLMGAAALLATAAVGGSLLLRSARGTSAPEPPASVVIVETPAAASAVAPAPAPGPSASAPAGSALALHVDVDQLKPTPRTVTPADLPAAPAPTPRVRRRPPPAVAGGADVDAALPSFPVPEADPAAPTVAATASPTPAASPSSSATGRGATASPSSTAPKAAAAAPMSPDGP
jgi:serine/threonine-protein kinase